MVVAENSNLFYFFNKDLRRRVLLFIPIWFSLNLIYYGYIFFNTSFFLLVVPSSCGNATDLGNSTETLFDNDVPCFPTEGLIILIIVSIGEAFGALFTAILINNKLPRRWIGFTQLMLSAVFLFLMFSTENVYFRAAFSLVARACAFGVFCAVYLWTPLVVPSHLRATAMGTMGSCGKIASICAPFISSLFDKDSIVIPVVVYGSVAFVCAILCLFVGIEPGEEESKVKEQDDETALLSHLTK